MKLFSADMKIERKVGNSREYYKILEEKPHFLLFSLYHFGIRFENIQEEILDFLMELDDLLQETSKRITDEKVVHKFEILSEWTSIISNRIRAFKVCILLILFVNIGGTCSFDIRRIFIFIGRK